MKRFHHTAVSILLCSSLLAGCAKEADITESSTDTAPTTTEETTTSEETTASEETTTIETVDLPDEIDEQLQIIYDNYETWMLLPMDDSFFSEEDELNSASFAVTVLDNDGMLEIIKTGWAGTAHNTRNTIYEVSEDGELVLITVEWDSPDLWHMDTVRYYTDDEGTRWNLVEDTTTENSTGLSRYVTYSRLSIDNGIVTETYCAEYYNPELDDETVCLYYDADNNEITQEEFEQITSQYDALVEGEAAFGWISANGQPTLEELAESYQTFMGL